jgi:hypothetical protein
MHINQNTDYIYLGEEPLKDAKYYGKMYYTDGSSYQGYFINGKKNGYGEEKNINGSINPEEKGFNIDSISEDELIIEVSRLQIKLQKCLSSKLPDTLLKNIKFIFFK